MEQGDTSPARALDQLAAQLRFEVGKRNFSSASHLTQEGRSKGFAGIEWARDTYGIKEERIRWSRRSGDEFFCFCFLMNIKRRRNRRGEKKNRTSRQAWACSGKAVGANEVGSSRVRKKIASHIPDKALTI